MIPEGWKCPRRIGFLFPHPCERLTPVGCPDCQNGMIDDPYRMRTDRFGYDDYDDYSGAAAAGAFDFTEADGADLVKPGQEFEEDMTES